MIDVKWAALAAWVALVTVGGCASDEQVAGGSTPAENGALNVSQGGAQDFAQFRALVEQGLVPAPELLDEVGFFAEHAMDLPPADCGEELCIHPFLSVMPRFDGSNWTMAFVAMNTPVDPSTLERPPVHWVLAVEEAVPFNGFPEAVSNAAIDVVAGLNAEDRVSVVTYGSAAELHASALPPSSPELSLELEGLRAMEHAADASVYNGLAGADRAIRAAGTWDGATRIVLLTTGRANSGVTSRDRIVGLGEALAKDGASLGIVGLGVDYDATLGAALGSMGAGTYTYAVDGPDLQEVLALEAETTLFPLATDFRMRIEPAPGYRVGRIYGAKRAWAFAGRANLDLPALFVGRREGATDVGGGRRGGGGGLFVELIADPDANVSAGEPAFSLTATWDGAAGEVEQSATVQNDLAPGENPDGMFPYFSDEAYGKPYIMLNMYLALDAAVTFYDGGDCSRAMGVIDMMAPAVEGWQGSFYDPDIDDDYQLMLRLRDNIARECEATNPAAEVIEPIAFDGGCAFFI